jgi:hypothetical protein
MLCSAINLLICVIFYEGQPQSIAIKTKQCPFDDMRCLAPDHKRPQFDDMMKYSSRLQTQGMRTSKNILSPMINERKSVEEGIPHIGRDLKAL